MDPRTAARSLASFFRRNHAALERLPTRQSQLLELAALMAAAEHYRLIGFIVEPDRLFAGRLRVKTSSRGYAWNFSFLRASSAKLTVDIHANLPVHGASRRDPGVYVVDIGVVRHGSVPDAAHGDWNGLKNRDLVTFVEAKRLVIYPMLLAHFLGIVHELKPRFLRGPAAAPSPKPHFYPTLAATGYFTPNARAIVDAYPARRVWVNVIPDLDTRIGGIAAGSITEPLGPAVED